MSVYIVCFTFETSYYLLCVTSKIYMPLLVENALPMAIGKTVAATSPYSAIPVWDVPLHAQDEKASTARPH